MKHLKLFLNDVDYQNYVKSDDYVKPNVSYAKDTDTVYYTPQEISSRQSMERLASDCNFWYDDMFGYWLISRLPEEYKIQNSIKNIILKPKNVSVESIPHIGEMFLKKGWHSDYEFFINKIEIKPEWIDVENNQIIYPYSMDPVYDHDSDGLEEETSYGLILCDLSGEYDTNESIMYDTIIEYELA